MKKIGKLILCFVVIYILLVFGCSYLEYYAYYGFTQQGLVEANPNAFAAILNVIKAFSFMAPLICFVVFSISVVSSAVAIYSKFNLYKPVVIWPIVLLAVNSAALYFFPINQSFGNGSMDATPMYFMFGFISLVFGLLVGSLTSD